MRRRFVNQGNLTADKLVALLFDVDGTLADTEEIHRLAFNAAFRDAGLDWSWDRDLYHKLLAVTGGKERIRYYLDSFSTDASAKSVTDDFIAGLHKAKTVNYTSALARGDVPLLPGIERLMLEARAQGLRLAIVTTTTPANVTALLDHSFSHDVSGWFDVIAAGSVVPNKKPAPDIYHYALEQLDLPASQCLAIEDSANGLRSARDADVDALITVNRYTEDHDFTGAALVLDHLGEPGNPCRVLAGELDPGGLVDTTFLLRLHAHCQAQRVHSG
ncbi:MAG: HAD family hydrolase [Gammaproteobacteria bacterium]|nr:HAD family hydrolase [Gammaproteobacteria bacterium]